MSDLKSLVRSLSDDELNDLIPTLSDSEYKSLMRSLSTKNQISTNKSSQQKIATTVQGSTIKGSEIKSDTRNIFQRGLEATKQFIETPRVFDKPETSPKEMAKTGAIATLKAAPVAMPQVKGGLLLRSGLQGLATGATEFGANLIEGKPIKESAIQAAKTGATVAGLGAGLEKGLQVTGKAALKVAKPLIESKAARKIIDRIDKKMIDLDSKAVELSRTKQLQGRELAEQESILLGELENKRRMEESLKAKKVVEIIKQNPKTKSLIKSTSLNPENTSKAIQSLIDDVDNQIRIRSVQTAQGIDRTQSEVKKVFSREYNQILNGKDGKLPVNIDDQMQNIIDAFNIKTISGSSSKDKISTVARQLIQNVNDQEVKRGLEFILKKYSTPEKSIAKVQGTVARDVHWLKLAIRDIADQMIGKAPNQEYAIRLYNISDDLASRLDNTLGGRYSELSGRYANFKQTEKLLNTVMGKEEVLGGVRQRPRSVSVLESAGKVYEDIPIKGKMTYPDYALRTNRKLEAVKNNIDLLRKQGLNDQADMIESGFMEIAKNNFSRANIVKTQSALKDALKGMKDDADISSLLKEIPNTMNAERLLAEKSKLESRLTSVRKQKEALKQVTEDERYISNMQEMKLKASKRKLSEKLIPEKGSWFGMDAIAMAGYPIGIITGFPKLGAYISALGAITLAVKNRPYLAFGALKAVRAIENKMMPHFKDAAQGTLYFNAIKERINQIEVESGINKEGGEQYE